MTRFMLFSRWGEYLGSLGEVYGATHSQEINSEDTLKLALPMPLAKGDRILWKCGTELFEHVVTEIDQEHDGCEEFEYTCEQAMMADLRAAHIKLFVGNSMTAEDALGTLLGQTTWEVGHVDPFPTGSVKWEKKSAYEALLDLAGVFGAEVKPTFTVGSGGVAHRYVNLYRQIGSDRGARFEYGHGMGGVKKTVLSDDVITACYGYGANRDTETDGVTDQLSFASINGGVPYVADEKALSLWGLPDGKGGRMHAFGYYENTDCEDAQQLLDETRAELAKRSTPSVSYETSLPFAQLKGVRLGDTVQVLDKGFTPELRLEARVGALERDVLTGRTSKATFGTVVSVLPDVYARLFTSVKSEGGGGDVSAGTIMKGMNRLYEKGGSYVCQTAADGIITANVPLDADGNPTVTEGELTARKIANGVIYSSTSVDSDGKWVWVISENQELEYLTNKDFLAKFGVEVE